MSRCGGLRSGLAAIALCAAGLTTGAAQAQFVVKTQHVEYDVRADGRYTKTEQHEVQAVNEAAAREIAQQSVLFSTSLDEIEVVAAHTIKRDGRRLPVDPKAMFVQLPQGSPRQPMFDDLRYKVIVFPDVAAGDSVGYTVKRHIKQPLFPGHFYTWISFPRTVMYQDARLTVIAPKTMPMRVEAHELVVEKHARGDSMVYEWRHATRGVLIEDPAAVASIDRVPRGFISSFKDQDELGRAYATLALPKAAVTPKIRALADQLTAGVVDRREQVRKLYDWVSGQIRYVAIALGHGGAVPHDAETVLANRYGDCKDHVVLFATLLKAKGIDSEMVLINSGASYRLSEVPTLAQLNHLISWIPELGIYADTTAGVAPLGVLPFGEYGKPVVHAVMAGRTLRATPVLARGVDTLETKTIMRLRADGRSTIESTTSASGPSAVVLRDTALSIQSNGSERAAKSEMRQYGIEGMGSYRFSTPHELAPSYSISGRFEADPRPHLLTGHGFSLAPGMGSLWRPGDLLMGYLSQEKLRDTEPTPCFSGRTVEEITLELPPGKRIARVPEPRDVTTPQLRYSARYTVEGQSLTVRREFSSEVDRPLCTGEVRKATARALADIRADYRTQIVITD